MHTVLGIGVYRFFFLSADGNEPPHIHIEAAENKEPGRSDGSTFDIR